MSLTDHTNPRSAPRVTGREEDLLAEEARRVLRSAMVRRGYSFKQLAEALEAQNDGAPVETAQALTNKVNRGRFSFAFVLRAARAMGMSSIELSAADLDGR